MNVRIDDDFARFGGKSYAINKITSVEVREHQPYSDNSFWPALISLGMIVAGLLMWSLDTVLLLGGGIVLGLFSAALRRRSRTIEYQLFLMTSSAEVQAFVSADEDEVLSLRDQIEDAMTRHSRAAFRR